MFLTKTALPRRTFLRGVGATRRPAAARRDGAGRHGPGADAGSAPVEGRLHLRAARGRHGLVDASRRGTQFELSPTLQTLEPFKDSLVVVSNLRRAGGAGRDARRRGQRLVERSDSQADRGRGLRMRHDDRSGAGPEDRAGVAVPVAGVRDRGLHWLRRRMHARLQLRLSRLNLLGVAHDAAARWRSIRAWPSSGCSATAARRRSASTSCARTGASSTASSARCARCKPGWAPTIARGWPTTWTTSARSNAGFNAARPSSVPTSRWSSRSAFPTRSTRTAR